jgi:hypothetical protein
MNKGTVKFFNEKKEQVQFIKELGALIDKYHASIYLIDEVFKGACTIVEAIKKEQNNNKK